MKNLLPQSLFGRLLGALIAVLFTTLLVIVVLILRERRDLALWGSGAWSSATTIAEASERLATLDPAARQVELENYRTRRPQVFPRLRPPPPPLTRERDILAIEKAFAERVRKQLGSGYSVSIDRVEPGDRNAIRLFGNETLEPVESPAGRTEAPPDAPRDLPAFPDGAPQGFPAGFAARAFGVTVTLPDGEKVVFRAPAPQPGPPLPQQIFLQIGLLTLILTFVLYFMTRTITRPLLDLADAADAVGRGENVAPLREQGARELRHATRAFNTMQDRLQRYLDSRTRVLAAMSHDLRTPLTRLRLRAESIDDENLRERFIGDVEEMTQMVNGALNLFKGLTDTEAYAPVNVDELLKSMQLEYAELGESITIEGRSNGSIEAKPLALKRCLSNLLHNAVKYGERAHVRVTDGAELSISIRDAGEGIPAEDLERVFEPFYRLESSRGRDTGGTGLGLSIARDIAQAHGGAVVLRNVPGGGLEALLTLPRTAAAH